MAQRTNTKLQTVFRFSDPDVVFDFADEIEGRIKVRVPAGSPWRERTHWHMKQSACERVTCIEGHLVVYSSRNALMGGHDSGGPGLSVQCQPSEAHGWSNLDTARQLEVDLQVNRSTTLYRNTCGARLDADRFPYFASTPFWVRILYSSLFWTPKLQRWLLSKFLWIQIQAMYYAHDFRAYHGVFDMPNIWHYTHPWRLIEKPPKWTYRVQWRSMFIYSRVTQTVCYWAAQLLLGMKTEYPEYTPSADEGVRREDHQDEKQRLL